MLNNDLDTILAQAKKEIQNASCMQDILLLKSKFVGKKSTLSSLMKRLGEIPKEERPAFGKRVNEVKKSILELLKIQENVIRDKEYEKTLLSEKLDLSMPGRKIHSGALHPITKIWREIEDSFISMGFDVAEGFDIEDEYHNFDALNTPQDHPARDLTDTFYIHDDVLLRTQTSTVQIRVMEKYKPPIRIISPGRCYRNDNDASHSPNFHQVEALVIDKNITFAHLNDILNIFVKMIFGENISSRIRPHFFPFTEPSAEIDIVCVNCGGKGCNVCKGSGWLEMGGAGMVDPNVLEGLGIDSEKFTGYAFGLGIDRMAMLKYKIPNMKLLFENDIRFLKQFR